MSLKMLLDKFDWVVQTPEDVEKVEEAILNLAVRGTLVPQDSQEESGASLLARIRAVRLRLYEEGKIRKPKRLRPVQRTDVDFTIPGTWEWVRLGDIAEIVGGGTPKTKVSEYWSERGIPWLTPADLGNQTSMTIGRGRRDISELGLKHSSARLLPKGSVLFSSRAPIGYVAITENDLATNQGFRSCVPYVMECNHYIYYFLKHAASQINRRASGTTFKEVSGSELMRVPVPLPPLNEQRRIVRKIGELFTQTRVLKGWLDNAANARVSLQHSATHHLVHAPTPTDRSRVWSLLSEHFDALYDDPEHIEALRQTILDLAVRGLLVPQDPEDESAEVLLQRIADEKARLLKNGEVRKTGTIGEFTQSKEANTDLPDGWMRATLGVLAVKIHYGYTASAKESIRDVRFLRITDIQDNQVDWDAVPGCEIEPSLISKFCLNKNDVLIARTGGTVGKTYLVEQPPVPTVFASYLIRVIPSSHLNARYFKLFLESPDYWSQLERQSKGTGQPNVNATSLSHLDVSVPPRIEQDRIVSKAEELLTLCLRLRDESRTSEAARNRLLHALVR